MLKIDKIILFYTDLGLDHVCLYFTCPNYMAPRGETT